jgi:thioredoxin reductase (NADPH)
LIETDALVIGAGPVGLFQVFELGLLELGAQVVDALPMPGGQCAALYPDKPIYDIPSLPVCSGGELTERLLRQVEPFKPVFHLGHEVQALQRQDDGRFRVETAAAGPSFLARAVVIAAGVGAFVPRTLKLPGLDAFAGTQLLHRVASPTRLAGQRVVVVGGDEAAVTQALALAGGGQAADPSAPTGHAPSRAAEVTLLHRRDKLDIPAALAEALHAACAAGMLRFVAGQIGSFDAENGRLNGRLVRVTVDRADGGTETLALDALLVLLGLSPRLGPIAQWGLAMQRKQLVVDTATFETTEPGIFAVGDVITYPGKRKLIVCGFHEATLAAYGISERLRGEPAQLEYTTSSSRLQRLLGVSTPTS